MRKAAIAIDTADLEKALNGADYPAHKDQLVHQAEHNESDAGTVAALRAIPPETYRGFDEVLASVPTTDHTSDAGKSAPHRQPRQGGLAEQEPADNPIVRELGENRGS